MSHKSDSWLTVEQTEDFATWLRGLADPIAQKAIAKRIVRVAGGLFRDADSVGGGVNELRFHSGPSPRRIDHGHSDHAIRCK